MKFNIALLLSTLVADATVWAALAPPRPVDATRLSVRDTDKLREDQHEFWKRRGGGGGGGRGGGGGSSGSSSGSSGGSSGGSTGGSSGGGSVGGSSGSSAGGRTATGSGARPAYGGGRYYGGGAAVPYRAGSPSPGRSITPIFFAGAFLAFWPGLWLYGAHMYSYPRPYSYYNQTAAKNETKPIICACAENSVCGCEDNEDRQYLNELVGNGSYDALNKSVINVADVNGTSTLLINGTLPDGTTAAGGEGDSNSAGDGLRTLLVNAGCWPLVATVAAIAFTA